MIRCGIVGLPNVGKSTLFNAITNTTNAQMANFPFCTIEPNSGIVEILDDRLKILAKISSSQKIIYNTIELVDIAGLVKGASEGEGLGNKFLANIREVDAIIHVVRCFNDDDIIHVNSKISPLDDIETINTELRLADISTIDKRIQGIEKKSKNDKTLQSEMDFLKNLLSKINNSEILLENIFSEDELKIIKQLNLFCLKRTIYVCNVDENGIANDSDFVKKVQNYAKSAGCLSVKISAKIEQELSTLPDEDRLVMLEEYGLKQTGLDSIVQAAYKSLDMMNFFTVGPQEARAWGIKNGTKAPQAAGVIHTDFERGFIKAEVFSCKDFIEFSGEEGAKSTGTLRLEGKEYIFQDGDVVHFKFNV